MLFAFRTIIASRFSFVLALMALSFGGAASTRSAMSQGTHLWTQSRAEEFEKGTPDGVAITSDGHLREAAGLKELLTTPSTYVWALAADKSGTVYVGTGAPATVLRVGADGKPFTLFETRDLTVQALKLGPDGALYAATMPSGKVYKLNPAASTKQDESSATVVFDAGLRASGKDIAESKQGDAKAGGDKSDAKTHYVWDLAFDPAGRLYVATGGPGAVYRVDPKHGSADAEEFFKSDEQHIRSMAWDAKGNLIAGSDGSGLVYRINAQGKGYVLFEAPRREITSVAVVGEKIYAASVGDKSRNPLPPLPVQGTATVTFTVVQPGSLQAANSSASAPEGTEIYALTEGQAPRRIWADKDAIVYGLAPQGNGVLAISGNRGWVFRINDDGSFADVAHLEAQQGLAMAVSSGHASVTYIGTGNSGKVYSLGETGKHEYASDVLDAGALARFGRMEVEPGSSGYHLMTRSGNVEQPVRGWSDWESVKDGMVVSPAGRFFEWKAVLEDGGEVGSVGVNYLPVNAAPVVDEIVVVPGARLNAQNQASNQNQTVNIAFPSANQAAGVSFDAGNNSAIAAMKDKTAITARWSAHDDNGDDLLFSLYLRGDGEHVWRLLKDGISERAYSFDAATIADGGYQLKVVATDAPSHNPGQALSGAKESDRFEVDTTSPVVSNLKAEEAMVKCATMPCPKSVRVTFDAEDGMSTIARAEYSLDAGQWQFIEPVGGLSDSKREHYEMQVPATAMGAKAGEHLLTVRVYDRHDNVGLGKVVFAASQGSAPADPAVK